MSNAPAPDAGLAHTELTPPAMEAPRAEQAHFPPQTDRQTTPADQTLKPRDSPVSSVHSRSSFNEQSDMDRGVDDPAATAERTEKRSRWRLSRRKDDLRGSALSPQRAVGYDAGAGTSTSSIGSGAHPRKSFTGDTVPVGSDSTLTNPIPQLSNDSSHIAGQSGDEKKGPLGWIKHKMREKREEREAEKERTKSPPAATERLPGRGRSMDIRREEMPEKIVEEPPVPSNNEPAPQ